MALVGEICAENPTDEPSAVVRRGARQLPAAFTLYLTMHRVFTYEVVLTYIVYWNSCAVANGGIHVAVVVKHRMTHSSPASLAHAMTHSSPASLAHALSPAVCCAGAQVARQATARHDFAQPQLHRQCRHREQGRHRRGTPPLHRREDVGQAAVRDLLFPHTPQPARRRPACADPSFILSRRAGKSGKSDTCEDGTRLARSRRSGSRTWWRSGSKTPGNTCLQTGHRGAKTRQAKPRLVCSIASSFGRSRPRLALSAS